MGYIQSCGAKASLQICSLAYNFIHHGPRACAHESYSVLNLNSDQIINKEISGIYLSLIYLSFLNRSNERYPTSKSLRAGDLTPSER